MRSMSTPNISFFCIEFSSSSFVRGEGRKEKTLEDPRAASGAWLDATGCASRCFETDHDSFQR